MSDEDLLAVAARQHGAVALFQAPMINRSPGELRSRLTTTGWERRSFDVFVRTGAPRTPAQDVAVDLLGCGPAVALSHSPGAGWWAIAGFTSTPVEALTKRRSRRRTPARRIHTVDIWPSEWITAHRGLQVCRPGLIILQLCASVHPDRAERALDNAWSLRIVSGRSLLALLAQLGRSGRNGTALLRRLVDARGADYIPPATNLESRASKVLERAGLRSFRRQVDSGGEQWSGRVDLREERRPVIVEIQSERYHTSLSDQRADLARRHRLEQDGFEVVEVTDDDVFFRPWVLVDRVRTARRRLVSRSTVPGVS